MKTPEIVEVSGVFSCIHRVAVCLTSSPLVYFPHCAQRAHKAIDAVIRVYKAGDQEVPKLLFVAGSPISATTAGV